MSEPPIVTSIVREHAELAAFLSTQRKALTHGEVLDREAIAGLDERIAVHLEGLRVAGQAAWAIIRKQHHAYNEEGEKFLLNNIMK